jgi:hypothetical protein
MMDDLKQPNIGHEMSKDDSCQRITNLMAKMVDLKQPEKEKEMNLEGSCLKTVQRD